MGISATVTAVKQQRCRQLGAAPTTIWRSDYSYVKGKRSGIVLQLVSSSGQDGWVLLSAAPGTGTSRAQELDLHRCLAPLQDIQSRTSYEDPTK